VVELAVLIYVAWLQLQIEEKIPDAAFAVRPHHVTNVTIPAPHQVATLILLCSLYPVSSLPAASLYARLHVVLDPNASCPAEVNLELYPIVSATARRMLDL
jgi:hypothetical protein